MLQTFWIRFWWQYLAKSNFHLAEATNLFNSVAICPSSICAYIFCSTGGSRTLFSFLNGSLLNEIWQLSEVKLRKKTLYCLLAVLLNPPLLWYFAESNFLFGWRRNLRYLSNYRFTRSRSRTPTNSEDKAICNNSFQLKAVYYSIATRSFILNVGRGPRPALDYNGIS